jgi:1-acyl-sn-glycerol-3-phosphate acyltransferase
MNWFYHAARALGRFCFNVFGRIEVIGLENVPPYGPLIVVANHISYNDPPALAVALPRVLSSLGKIELFSNPVKKAIMRASRVYPVDRSANGVDAIRAALDLLAQDQALVIFPEGRISPHRAMQAAKAGAAYLAIKSQAPILPVGITGTEKFPPRRMLFPFRRFRVNIGQPFTPPVLEGRIGREATNGVLDMIMFRIAVLLPEEYQGVYAIAKPRASTDRAGQPLVPP